MLNPIARNTDPLTSHLAEAEMNKGRRKTQMIAIYLLLKAHPGLTARELAVYTDYDYHTLHKRLPDLRANNMAVNDEQRLCSVAKRKCQTWVAK